MDEGWGAVGWGGWGGVGWRWGGMEFDAVGDGWGRAGWVGACLLAEAVEIDPIPSQVIDQSACLERGSV